MTIRCGQNVLDTEKYYVVNVLKPRQSREKNLLWSSVSPNHRKLPK